MVNRKARDKFLTSSMGLCNHEKYVYINHCLNSFDIRCDYCGTTWPCCDRNPKINFSTWEGFGKLWEWSMNQDWFSRYNLYKSEPCFLILNNHDTDNVMDISKELINPDMFADRIYMYLTVIKGL